MLYVQQIMHTSLLCFIILAYNINSLWHCRIHLHIFCRIVWVGGSFYSHWITTIRAWTSNYIHIFLRNVSTHPCCNLSSYKVYPALTFWYGWIIICHIHNTWDITYAYPKKILPIFSSLSLHLNIWSSPGGRLNKKDGLTRYGDSHVKDKTS